MEGIPVFRREAPGMKTVRFQLLWLGSLFEEARIKGIEQCFAAGSALKPVTGYQKRVGYPGNTQSICFRQGKREGKAVGAYLDPADYRDAGSFYIGIGVFHSLIQFPYPCAYPLKRLKAEWESMALHGKDKGINQVWERHVSGIHMP